MSATRHIVILGAGFGGLTAAKMLRHPSARITVVDRQNHHLFQPLLYQVATAGLSAAEIAQPVRSILSRRQDVTVLMDTVTALDLEHCRVGLGRQTLSYDYLVLALGGVTSYFGHPEWEQYAPGLKTLQDALRIRQDALLAFERAERETDPKIREQLMTIVIVGGGPTGVELAGAFAELSRNVLRADFRHIDPGTTRILLLEAGPDLLPHMPEDLRISARRQLEALGVTVHTGARVEAIDKGQVRLMGGKRIEAANIIWAAGIQGHPLTRTLEVPKDRAGRIMVRPDLSIPGYPEAFVVGDLAHVVDKKGHPVPGVAPAAMQMARHVSHLLELELDSGPRPPESRRSFHYWDKGTMATIGRSAAVAQAGPVHLSGWLAWMSWLCIHLLFLVGLRNKLAVVLQWIYAYLAYKRGARIITVAADAVPEGVDDSIPERAP